MTPFPHQGQRGPVHCASALFVQVEEGGDGLLADVAVHGGFLGGEITLDRGHAVEDARCRLLLPCIAPPMGVRLEIFDISGGHLVERPDAVIFHVGPVELKGAERDGIRMLDQAARPAFRDVVDVDLSRPFVEFRSLP